MPSRTKKKQSKRPSRSRRPDASAYQIVVCWSDEDGCFLARVPAFQGCVTHGDTPDEALRSGLEAAELWLEDALRHGDPIPPPRRVVSGKLTLRMPRSLHEKVADAAERDGVSINQWVVTHIAGSV